MDVDDCLPHSSRDGKGETVTERAGESLKSSVITTDGLPCSLHTFRGGIGEMEGERG